MNKRQWKITPLGLTNLIIFVFLVGALSSPFIGNCRERQSGFIFGRDDNPLLQSKAVAGALDLQEALREIHDEVNPAVVRIETEQSVKIDPRLRYFFGEENYEQFMKRKRQGLGSGFIISGEGYIVTNDHVVHNVDKITVQLQSGNTYDAKLIGTDSISDIALLKINSKEKLKVVHMGDSEKVRVGDFGIAIGNPFGLQSTFTLGVISSTGQDINTADGIPRIQTDAAINPGNSGGPLLNIKGELIGINQMISSPSGGSVGIGFAIPVNYALEIIEKLKTGKKINPGYIGVVIETQVTEKIRDQLKLGDKPGLLISQVGVGTPAWDAGLRPYDFITKIDNVKAEKFSDLKKTVIRKGAGSIVEIEYLRDGQISTAKVTLGEAPETN